MDMTIPGVQNPHWDPWLLASRSWTALSFPRVEPMPSTVVTASPCMEHTGAKQALTAKWLNHFSQEK